MDGVASRVGRHPRERILDAWKRLGKTVMGKSAQPVLDRFDGLSGNGGGQRL